MEPAFFRGDLLFLAMDEGPFTVGEIVVFKIEGKEIPIVHRITKVHETYVNITHTAVSEQSVMWVAHGEWRSIYICMLSLSYVYIS